MFNHSLVLPFTLFGEFPKERISHLCLDLPGHDDSVLVAAPAFPIHMPQLLLVQQW
ncbi:MAG: hypothetical protein HQK61_04745 [Desulfamplus sp.]|nr:hypothetical protein [Desulfamplus sp.]